MLVLFYRVRLFFGICGYGRMIEEYTFFGVLGFLLVVYGFLGDRGRKLGFIGFFRKFVIVLSLK